MPIRVLFADSASGTKGGDSFGLALAEQHGPMTVLQAVRGWHPPFSPVDVIQEVVAYAKALRIPEIVGDNWSGQLLQEMIQQASGGTLAYRVCEWTKAELYLRLLPLINAGRVRLLDHPDLLRQLRGLERRRGWGGRDRVDHRRGQHDDLANAAAGAIVLAAQGSTYVPARLWMSGDPPSDSDAEAREWAAEREVDHQDLLDRIRRGGGAYLPGIGG